MQTKNTENLGGSNPKTINELFDQKYGAKGTKSREDFEQRADAYMVAELVKESRIKHRLSQIDLAQRMKSSQSRIAKIEAGDPSVSLDLIVRALIASGATTRDIQVAFTTNERMAG